MNIHPDFKELLALFNKLKVEYIVVGAYALAYHGVPRYTGDMDLLVRPTSENAKRTVLALNKFGFKSAGFSADDFTTPGTVIQLGVPPVRIDLLTSLTGVSWEEADAGKAAGNYGNLKISFLGRNEFIANKKAIGRLRDLADIEQLEK